MNSNWIGILFENYYEFGMFIGIEFEYYCGFRMIIGIIIEFENNLEFIWIMWIWILLWIWIEFEFWNVDDNKIKNNFKIWYYEYECK